MKLSKIKQIILNDYIYQKQMAFILNDSELISELDKEIEIDLNKSDEQLINEISKFKKDRIIKNKLKQLESDFE